MTLGTAMTEVVGNEGKTNTDKYTDRKLGQVDQALN